MSRYYTSTRFRPECPTCGNKIGQLEESFKRLQEQGKTPAEALQALGINRPCCRVRALWPVVLPLGGFYLPHHEASMLNYLGMKEPTPQPNLVILSLKRAANNHLFVNSHVDEHGFIGRIATTAPHETTDITIHSAGKDRKIVLRDECELNKECQIRVQTEPGEITRGFPFETRAFRRDIEVDRVRSYFDLPPEEEPVSPEPIPAAAPDVYLDEGGEDEPLVATS